MVQTLKTSEPATSAYVVLRPIFIGGERCESGSTVQLTKPQGSELAAAAKVAADGTPAAKAAQDAAKAAAKAAKASAAEAAAEAADKAPQPTTETATSTQEGNAP